MCLVVDGVVHARDDENGMFAACYDVAVTPGGELMTRTFIRPDGSLFWEARGRGRWVDEEPTCMECLVEIAHQ